MGGKYLDWKPPASMTRCWKEAGSEMKWPKYEKTTAEVEWPSTKSHLMTCISPFPAFKASFFFFLALHSLLYYFPHGRHTLKTYKEILFHGLEHSLKTSSKHDRVRSTYILCVCVSESETRMHPRATKSYLKFNMW